MVILAPLGAVSLLWNAFFARFILGDVFSPWMVLGTILIAGGAVLIAIFGIVPEPTHSLQDLLELFQRPPFIVYFSLLGLGVFLSLVLVRNIHLSLLANFLMDARLILASFLGLARSKRFTNSPPLQHIIPVTQKTVLF